MVQMNLTVPQAAERSSPVILSEAKDLAAGRERPFAEFTLERSEGLKVTRCNCSNSQEHFVQIELCLNVQKGYHPIHVYPLWLAPGESFPRLE
jgi:hypothetical protein